MPCIWKPEGKCSYRYGATPHNKGAFTYPRFMPCIWKPEGKCSYRYGATPTIKVLNLPTAYAMYMEAGTHGLCHVYGNRRKNVVTAMVLLPTIKVLLPTHGLCHVYGNRRENVVTAMVLLPKIKVMQLLIWCH